MDLVRKKSEFYTRISNYQLKEYNGERFVTGLPKYSGV